MEKMNWSWSSRCFTEGFTYRCSHRIHNSCCNQGNRSHHILHTLDYCNHNCHNFHSLDSSSCHNPGSNFDWDLQKKSRILFKCCEARFWSHDLTSVSVGLSVFFWTVLKFVLEHSGVPTCQCPLSTSATLGLINPAHFSQNSFIYWDVVFVYILSIFNKC